MPTEKLYFADPFAATFVAPGAARSVFAGAPSIVLSRTVFYPEAGGQLGDRGSLTIGGVTIAIDDVQIDDDETIHHLPAPGSLEGVDVGAGEVRGELDLARRRDHMAQHTAQHMISRALAEVARAETVSARLGASACTVDLSTPSLAEPALASAEDLVNALIRDDVAITSSFPSPAELESLPLRRAPKVTKNVRLIAIGDFDLTPCGGTHCTRTGQIGLFRVAGTERYKGGVRVFFHAGLRALRDVRAKDQVLAALARDLTCGPMDVGGAVAKVRADLKLRLDALSAARGELVVLLADKLLAEHPPDASGTTRIVIVRERDDVGMLRTLAGRLASRADVVAICASPAGEGDDLLVVAQRGSSAAFDCAAWLKAAAERCGGRGGGKPDRAEGRLPRSALSSPESH